jgi:hypothetical protein
MSAADDAEQAIGLALSQIDDRLAQKPSSDEEKKLLEAKQALALQLAEVSEGELDAGAKVVAAAAAKLQQVIANASSIPFADYWSKLQDALTGIGITPSPAPPPSIPASSTTPTSDQIADAMKKIAAVANATPPPPAATKQAMDAAYQTLTTAFGYVVQGNSAAASTAAGDAAKQLQAAIDSGTANADAIQPILAALGVTKSPPVATPGQTSPPAKPSALGTGTDGGSGAAAVLGDRVPLPPLSQVNVGLSACMESTMLKKFGTPGSLTVDCSPATGAFVQRVRQSFDVGPFRVTGLDYAVESLRQVFSDVSKDNQQLYNQVKNAGMICVRARRHNLGHFSDHSWGTAIDIYFGAAVVPQGLRLANRGNLLLAPYFNRHGWYWGAGFSGDSVDSMHFELADETISKIPDEPMFDVASSPALAGGTTASTPPAAVEPDPASKQLLGSIVASINKAQPVKQSFAGVTFAGTLPSGELVYESELQLDTDGWPGGNNQTDSTWQPQTSLRYVDGSSVNANTVPYFVLPQGWYGKFGIKLGDIGALVYKDKLVFAVFADAGPKNKLGEASLNAFRQLGEERLRPNGKIINIGMGGGITTIVFPGTKADAYQDEKSLLNYVTTRGQISFLQLGGNLPSEVGKS